MFVTSTTYGAVLRVDGGAPALANADAHCQQRGSALGGAWKAWISTPGNSAISRIADVGPWYLVDQTTLVFASKAALTADPVHAIDRTESGVLVSVDQPVWTGTTAAGLPAADTCAGWTSDGPDYGEMGLPVATPSGWWTDRQMTGCAAYMARLYCFEQ